MIKFDNISPCKEVIDDFQFLSFATEHEIRLYSLWDESLRAVGQQQHYQQSSSCDATSATTTAKTTATTPTSANKRRSAANNQFRSVNRQGRLNRPLQNVSQLHQHQLLQTPCQSTSPNSNNNSSKNTPLINANSSVSSKKARSSGALTDNINSTCSSSVASSGGAQQRSHSPDIITQTLWPQNKKLPAIAIRSRIRAFKLDYQQSPETIYCRRRAELIRRKLNELTTIVPRHAHYAVEAVRLTEDCIPDDIFYTFNTVTFESLIAAKHKEPNESFIPRIPAEAFTRPTKRFLYDGTCTARRRTASSARRRQHINSKRGQHIATKRRRNLGTSIILKSSPNKSQDGMLPMVPLSATIKTYSSQHRVQKSRASGDHDDHSNNNSKTKTKYVNTDPNDTTDEDDSSNDDDGDDEDDGEELDEIEMLERDIQYLLEQRAK